MQSGHCATCGRQGATFGVAATTATKIFWKRTCKACCLASARQHAALKKVHRDPPEACECCGRRGGGRLVIDHCHREGSFRGWLCRGCNVSIGGLGDTAEGVRRALAYLSRQTKEQLRLSD